MTLQGAGCVDQLPITESRIELYLRGWEFPSHIIA